MFMKMKILSNRKLKKIRAKVTWQAYSNAKKFRYQDLPPRDVTNCDPVQVTREQV